MKLPPIPVLGRRAQPWDHPAKADPGEPVGGRVQEYRGAHNLSNDYLNAARAYVGIMVNNGEDPVRAGADYLDPENPAHERYEKGGHGTSCNLYALDKVDVLRAFAVEQPGPELPRVWPYYPDKYDPAQPPRYGDKDRSNGVHECNANFTTRWAAVYGLHYGWSYMVDSAHESHPVSKERCGDYGLLCANAGMLVVLLAENRDPRKPGHEIVMLSDFHGGKPRVRVPSSGALCSQAGARNWIEGRTKFYLSDEFRRVVVLAAPLVRGARAA